MNYDETLAIMSVLKAAYPAFYRDMTRKDAEAAVALWAEMFKDDPAEVVALAVKSFIASDAKGFPPNIGTIRAAIVKLREPDEMTPQEAWTYVDMATRRSIPDLISLWTYASSIKSQTKKFPRSCSTSTSSTVRPLARLSQWRATARKVGAKRRNSGKARQNRPSTTFLLCLSRPWQNSGRVS